MSDKQISQECLDDLPLKPPPQSNLIILPSNSASSAMTTLNS